MAGNQVEIVLRAVDQASAALKAAKDGLGSIDAQAKTTSRTLKQLGDSMVSIGTQLSLRVTAPIVAFGVASLKMGADFETAMNRVAALSGASSEQLVLLTDTAKSLGATTQFSASQAADAMGFMAMAGMKTDDILGSMESTLRLAAAAQLDMASSADIVTNILSGYGMETSELGHAVDVLTKAFTSANTDLTQLAEAMKYAGPVANSAGVQFEEAAAAIAMMGNAGIQGSMAGTSLRGAITRLLSPTAAAAAVMQDLGLKATDSRGRLLPLSDIVEQLGPHADNTAAFMEIFGQRAGPAMAALVSQGAEALRDLTGELEASGGTAERIADVQMAGLNGALELVRSAAEALGIAIAQSGLQQWAENAARALATFLQRVSELNPVVLRWGTIIAGVAAAIGPLLIAVGAFIRVLPVLRANLVAVRTVLLTYATPILAIAGLVLALKVAWDRNFLGIQETTAKVVEWLGRAFNTVVAFGSSLIRNWETIAFAWGQIQESLGRIAQEGGQVVAGAWEVATLAVQRAFTAMFSFVERGLSSMAGGIVDGINAVIAGINRTLRTDIPEVTGVALTAWASVDAQTTASLNAAQQRVADAQANMGTEIRFIQATVATAVDIIVRGMGESGDAVEALGEVAAAVGMTVQDVVALINGDFDELTTSVDTTTESVVALKAALEDLASAGPRIGRNGESIGAPTDVQAMIDARVQGRLLEASGRITGPRAGVPTPGVVTPDAELYVRPLATAILEAATEQARAAVGNLQPLGLPGAYRPIAMPDIRADVAAAIPIGITPGLDVNTERLARMRAREARIAAVNARAAINARFGTPEALQAYTDRAVLDPRTAPVGIPLPDVTGTAGPTVPVGITPGVEIREDPIEVVQERERAERERVLAEEMQQRRAVIDQLTTMSAANGPLANLGASLLNLAVGSVPGVKAAFDGFVQGGPMGALIGVFTDLLGRSQGFKDLLEAINTLLEPLIVVVGQAASAFIPLVNALQPLVQLIVASLQPAMNLLGWLLGGLAKVVDGVVNVLVDIWNFLFGWIPGMRVTRGGPGGGDGLIAALQQERQALVDAITSAASEAEIATLNTRLAEIDAELARLRGLGSDTGTPAPSPDSPAAAAASMTFGALPPAVQLAVATPLREAADTMLEAATIIRDVYASPDVQATASTRTFGTSVERFGDYVERLVTEGIRVLVETGTGRTGTSTAALR